MAATPFTFAGALRYPPNGGEAVADRPYSVQSSFDSNADYRLVLPGAGTISVSFGTIAAAGVKALLVEVEADTSPTAAPVNFVINGGDEPIEISPGGFLAFSSPKPVAGITSLDVTATAAAVVKIWLLG